MALSRVKTWVDGERLFAADQNGEFNNILNNPIALISPTTGAINFNAQPHTGLLPSAVTGTSGSTGGLVGILPSGSVGFIDVGSAASRVRGLIGNLSSQTGTFQADMYQMQSSSALTWMVSATSFHSANVGTAGPVAGGRDKAAAISSTEVHWYAITTGPGSTTPASIVSSQAPPQGPVLPPGYFGWTYLGASPYTSASTTILQDMYFRGQHAAFAGRSVFLNGGNATTETTVTYSSMVPANAGSIYVSADLATASAAVLGGRVRVVSGSDYHVLVTPPIVNGRETAMLILPNINRTVFYNVDSITASLFLYMTGYTMPNGG